MIELAPTRRWTPSCESLVQISAFKAIHISGNKVLSLYMRCCLHEVRNAMPKRKMLTCALFPSCTRLLTHALFYSCTQLSQATRFFLSRVVDPGYSLFSLAHRVDPVYSRFALARRRLRIYSLFSLARLRLLVRTGLASGTRFSLWHAYDLFLLYAFDHGYSLFSLARV